MFYIIQIFGGVGIACLPLGLIFSFIRRPKAVITRSQYIKVLLYFLSSVKVKMMKIVVIAYGVVSLVII